RRLRCQVSNCAHITTCRGGWTQSGDSEKAWSCGKQATTMDWNRKQHETEPSIYGKDQTRPNSLGTLRAATTTHQPDTGTIPPHILQLSAGQLVRTSCACGVRLQQCSECYHRNIPILR